MKRLRVRVGDGRPLGEVEGEGWEVVTEELASQIGEAVS